MEALWWTCRSVRVGAKCAKRFSHRRMRVSRFYPGDQTSSPLVQHPIVTMTGKAFYDIDHSGKDTRSNRRNYDPSLAVWEIHPVMRLAIGNAAPTSVTAAPAPRISESTPPKVAPPPATIPQPTAM